VCNVITSTLRYVARAAGVSMGPRDVGFTGVCTDTRLGCQGALFFALKGEKADGHEYVTRAHEGGAVAAVVERYVEGCGMPQLVVPDVLRALGDLARDYARDLKIPKVAITGSVGKTSARAMIAHALGGRYVVHQSAGNQNNEIGVPLTVLGIGPEHTAAVIEMGMRGKGQIAHLARIVAPTIALITNIGMSHIELLGSRDAIADAKAELFDALPPGALAIVPRDDPYCDYLAARTISRVRSFAQESGSDFTARNAVVGSDGTTRFTIGRVPFEVPAPGLHLAATAAAACAVGWELKVSVEETAERLRTFRLPDMRMTVRDGSRGVTILDDCYNAAPDSVRSALATLHAMAGPARRRAVAVLGDMRELGSLAERSHAQIGAGTEIASLGALVTVGPLAALMAHAAETREGPRVGRVVRCDDAGEAARAIGGIVEPGDVVLVKGSRAMAMEGIVAALWQAPGT
jgi:UDP-N-acetylmuramoyl-tripeptide--D-alanyl-D-alanine ligase